MSLKIRMPKMQNLKFINILLLFFFLNSLLFGLNVEKSNGLIRGNVLTFEDVDGKLHIEDVSQIGNNKFTPSDNYSISLNNTHSKYWIKINIDIPKGKFYELEVAQPVLPQVTIYYQDSLSQWQSFVSGYEVNIFKKLFKHQTQIFELNGDNSTYYLEMNGSVMPLPLNVWSKENLENHILRKNWMHGLYSGFMIFVIIINLLLYFSLRKIGYLHYAILVIMYAFFASLLEGYILYLIPNLDLQKWYFLNPIINQPNGMLFCLIFLDVKKYLPKVYKYVFAFFIYLVSYILWFRFFDVSQYDSISQTHALLGIIVMGGLGIAVARKGNVLGYYFALAYVLFFIFASLEISYLSSGYPPYLLGISYVSYGILVEVLILAILLAKRFEIEKTNSDRERKYAQTQLLDKTIENERIIKEQNSYLELNVKERTQELNKTIQNLKSTQAQLIQSEKMASLGELTAGIAHEIQNPLNFVNNFSEVSVELLSELKDELDKGDIEEAKAISQDVIQNLQKINHHGQRASSIVKGMLGHSRASSGQKEATDVNVLADEYLRLAYHGLRAKDKFFNASLNTNFDPNIESIPMITQDIGRVFLNLFTNAFYSVSKKKKETTDLGYEPTVSITTISRLDGVEIEVEDNGEGIDKAIQDKIFQPFFTTKPTGEGTGLGLSLSYDIVKSHGGKIQIESELGQGSKFKIFLPK